MLKRILIIGAPHTGKLRLTKGLCGEIPHDIQAGGGQHGGLMENLHLKTPYYEHDITVWIDEFTENSIRAVSEWAELFQSQEAQPVREMLGAIIFTIKPPQNEKDLELLTSQLESFHSFLKFLDNEADNNNSSSHDDGDEGWEGIKLLVGDNKEDENDCLFSSFDYLDDLARCYGLEYVELNANSENEYGEPSGKARILQALEAFDWHSDATCTVSSDKLFDPQQQEMKSPLIEKQQPSKDDVDKLELVMNRALEIKHHRHNMTPEEKKTHADWLARQLDEFI